MTKVRYKSNPTWHETHTVTDGRAICVAETPSNLLLRLKGTRQILELPWSMAYLRAATMRAQLNRLQKFNERRARSRVAKH